MLPASPMRLLFAFAAVALGAAAAADPTRPAPWRPQEFKKVKVTVVVILASDRCDYVDERLKCIADEVRKKERHLTGFSLASMAYKSVEANEKVTFPLVEGRQMEVVVQKCADKFNRVCLAITLPPQCEVVYRVVCGKFLPISTGCLTQEKVAPCAVVAALALAGQWRGAGPALAARALAHAKTRDRLMLAICVQPCSGK